MKREIGLFFLLLISATDNDDIICSSEPVKAAVGDNVTLDCHLKSKRDVTGALVEWKFNGSHYVVVHRSGGLSPDDQTEQFKNRATFVNEKPEKGNFTVQISSVNTTDGGIYTCSVKIGKQPRISCNVHLIVDGNKGGNIGHIVGGFFGGVVVVLAVVLGFLIWKRPQDRKSLISASHF
ncbi:butyrophilin subfamily 2 member A1-like isoform X1 [Thunnus albacares]|uniref:butyrophilin subfamily 2 member A1-like isoform X1 n=1 Tax=Thunnus albacares TaxID=8236 RepID=UPI001CF617EE|nr:butyrophilin subfamily 2 member A1-like isoform X1 [Thunnus albacares]